MKSKSHVLTVRTAGSDFIYARDLNAKPPLITHFSTDKLRSFIDNGIKPKSGNFSSHFQSVEKNV